VDKTEDNAVSILWPSMYPTLGLTVGQLGPVLGVSRLVMTLMLPVWGYAADSISRKTLLVWFTGIWGLWTLTIGLVDSFSQLLVIRVLSSLGLGVFAPAAFSLVGDLFGHKTRGRAAGTIEGVGLLGILASFSVLPLVVASSPEAWRVCFVVIGGASFITGILLASAIEEPPRGTSEAPSSDVRLNDAAYKMSLTGLSLTDLRQLLRLRSWRWLLFKDILIVSSFSVFTGWAVTWMFGLGIGETAFIVLTVLILGGVIGHLTFGWLGDYLEKRGMENGRVIIILVGLITMLSSFLALVFFGANGVPMLITFGVLYTSSSSASAEGVSWPIGQAVLPPELRGRGRAIINMLAGAVAALMLIVSGTLADQVGITTMLQIMIPVPILLSILLWLPMLRDYSPDRAALEASLTERQA
jgi:MFS family permease